MSSFPYSRREGAEDYGHEYEHLMTAMFSLRFALSKNLEEFWIASNVNNVSDFDDIVMSLITNTGDKIAFLIQLKHLESKTKVLNLESFTYSKENRVGQRKKNKESFSIGKYWEGFDEFQTEYLNSEESDAAPIIKELRKAHKIILVLYTNKGVDNGDYLKKPEVSDNFFDLLDTNDMKHCHAFNHEHKKLQDYNTDFLCKLRLFASQSHADEVKNLIKTEIKNLLKLKFPSMVDFNDVVNQYIQYVKTWIKGYTIEKKKMCYTLTKPEVLKILVGILLDTYKHDFSKEHFTSYEDVPKTIWNQIIYDKAITFLKKNDRVTRFIQAYYGSEVRKFIDKPPTVWSELIAKSAEKKFCANFGHAEVAQVCQNIELSMALIYKTLWMYGTVPLLLHLNKSEHFKDILKILQVCQHSIKVIVLVDDISNVSFRKNNKYSYFVTFHDLPLKQQEIILGVKVNFQGRIDLLLGDLVNESMHSTIKCHDVINILCGEFMIGAKLEKTCKYFVERSLSRVVLRYNVLEILSESFVIETHDIESAQEILKQFIADDSKIDLVNPDQVMKKLKSVEGTRHRLIYKEGYLEWVESVGDISNLRNYQVHENLFPGKADNEHIKIVYELNNSKSKEYVENFQIRNMQQDYKVVFPQYRLMQCEESFSKKLINRTHIVSDCPGMGKSTLIDFMAFLAPSDIWVIKIKLTDMVAVLEATIKKSDSHGKATSKPAFSASCHSDLFSDSDSSSNDDDILSKTFDIMKYFNSVATQDGTIPTSEITLTVFKKFYRDNKILLLFDGFDEISILYKEKVTEIIATLNEKHHQIWVTTRDHMKIHLEDTLGVLASTIKPFTRPEQKSFLINYFKANIETSNEAMIEQFADCLLTAAKKNLSDRDGQFTGIPLQTSLLAGSYLKHCKESCGSNRIKLNERFDLLKLYDKFVKIKNKILIKEKFGSNEKILLKSIDIEEAQQYFALCTVFGKSKVRELNMSEKFVRHCEDIKSQILQREGILVVRKSQSEVKVDFIHRTFAEYFAAKFLSQNFSSKEDSIRRNVLSLLKLRFARENESGRYEFLFTIFDRILAEGLSLHLNIINLKIDKIERQMNENPEGFLEQDGFNRSGLHMLILYGIELSNEMVRIIPKIDLVHRFVRCVESFEVYDLTLTDCLGYNVLKYCVYCRNWKFADVLCSKVLYLSLTCGKDLCLPLPVYDDAFFPSSNNAYLRNVSYNFLVSDLLRGLIYEDTSIYDFCIRNNLKTEIQGGFTKQFKTQPGIIVSDFLMHIGIKDSKTSKYSDIRLAVALGSKTNVEDLLVSKEIDVNERNGNNNDTLLHYAAYNRRSEIFELLMERGADINFRGQNKRTVLHTLAITGQVHSLEKYLDRVENLDVTDRFRTPLDCAIEFNQIDDARILIRKGAKINNRISSDHLYLALEDNDIETAKLLIEFNNTIFNNPNHDRKFLHLVAAMGNRKFFDYFVSEGFDINNEGEGGRTPLVVAIEHGHVELAEYIISLGAVFKDYKVLCQSIDLENEKLISFIDERYRETGEQIIGNRMPLMLAAKRGKFKIFNFLFNRCPTLDLTTPDDYDYTLLHYAATHGNVNLVLKCLNLGVNIDAQSFFLKTPLLNALEECNWEIAKVLLNNNANVHLEDNKGDTALHYVAQLGHVGLTKKLLVKGAKVNIVNYQKFTSLLLALKHGNNKIADLLVYHRANLTRKTLDKSTALHLASAAGNIAIVKKCFKLKIHVNKKNIHGNTALLDAVKNNQIKTAQLLIKNGADVSVQNFSQETILHAAARHGNDAFVSQMLNENLDVNALNYRGETPLCIALFYKNLSTAELLLSKGSRIDTVPKNECSVLHLAAALGFEKLVKECLKNNNVDINKKDEDGFSPLKYALRYAVELSPPPYAVRHGMLDFIKLLTAGASVEGDNLSYLFDITISKIKTQKDLSEFVDTSRELINYWNNIKNANTILPKIILSARAKRSSMNDYSKKFFEEYLKLLVNSGADVLKDQGHRLSNLISEGGLDHLWYIFIGSNATYLPRLSKKKLF